MIDEIEADELARRLQGGAERLRLVDVRTPTETGQGIIEGSECVPLHILPLRVAEWEATDTIVFICHSGARSAQACRFMAAHGHDHVLNLRGGILAWARLGLPVVRALGAAV